MARETPNESNAPNAPDGASMRAESSTGVPPGQDASLASLARLFRAARRSLLFRRSAFYLECFAGSALALGSAWVLASTAASFSFSPALQRALAIGYGLLLLAASAAAAWAAWRRTPRAGELALQLEARIPEYQGSLLTAVEALSQPGRVPPAVASLSAERAVKVFWGSGGGEAAGPPLRWPRAHLGLAGALSAALFALALGGSAFLESLRQAFSETDHPERTARPHFDEVLPGRAERIEGETLAIETRISGVPAAGVRVRVRTQALPEAPTAARAARASPALVREAGRAGPARWRVSLGPLRKSFRYRLVAQGAAARAVPGHAFPDAATPWFPVAVRPRVRLQRIAARVEPPGYAGLKARWLEAPEKIEALAQARITVFVWAGPGRDLGPGWGTLPGGARRPLARRPDERGQARYRLRFSARRSGLLRVNVTPRMESHAGVQALLALHVLPDRPPTAEAWIPPEARPGPEGLPVEVELRDDLGLAAARLRVRDLPPAPGRAQRPVPLEASYEIPLAANRPEKRRRMEARWMLPLEGLGPWLAEGFQYRVEADDTARPTAQTGRSPWRRWEPSAASGLQAERTGMLDTPQKNRAHRPRRPRRLIRKNAFGKIPDPSPEELAQWAQLGDPGDGQRPQRLRRPRPQHLEEQKPQAPPVPPRPDKRASASAGAHAKGRPSSAQAGGREGGKPRRGGGNPNGGAAPSGAGNPSGEYDAPQGLDAPKRGRPAPQPVPDAGTSGTGGTSETGETSGTSGPGGKTGGASGSKPHGAGGKARSGTKRRPGKTRKEPPGKGKRSSSDRGASGGKGSRGGRAASAGGSQGRPGRRGKGRGGEAGAKGKKRAGSSGRAGGKEGAGPKKPRDGGRKTGRELGPGSGPMAPPDLRTLARMKGITLEEARRYAAAQKIKAAQTGFGERREPGARERGGKRNPRRFGAFHLSSAPPKPERAEDAAAPKQTPPQALLEGLDERYRALVKAYFQRLREGPDE